MCATIFKRERNIMSKTIVTVKEGRLRLFCSRCANVWITHVYENKLNPMKVEVCPGCANIITIEKYERPTRNKNNRD